MRGSPILSPVPRLAPIIALALLVSAGFGTATSSSGPVGFHLDCADTLFVGDAVRDNAGMSIAVLGDVTGDGQADLAISAPNARLAGARSGSVHIVSDLAKPFLDDAQFIITGATPGDQAGTSVAAAGDVNGDGHEDLLIGAPLANPGPSTTGAAYLFYGPITSLTQDLSVTSADVTIENSAFGRLGHHVRGIGDINGDGYDDIAIAVPTADAAGVDGSGAVLVYHGPLTGTLGPADADLILYGEAVRDNAGLGLASGDVNGDGTPDLIVGAPLHDAGGDASGRVYVVYGSASLPAALPLAAADIVLDGAQADDFFGYSVAAPGDVTGDGVADLLVGAPRDDAGAADGGAVYVFAGPVTSGTAANAIARIAGTGAARELGFSVGGIGDFDGDGQPDIATGAPSGFASPATGGLYIYRGGTTLTGALEEIDAMAAVHGAEEEDLTGYAFASGQLDTDSAMEVLVAAPSLEAPADNEGGIALVDWAAMTTDSDGDELQDGCEANRYGTDPLVGDTDADGLSDGSEVFTFATDPLDPDTDGDLFSDGAEVSGGSDPKDPTSLPFTSAVTDPAPSPFAELPVTDDLDPVL